MLREEMLDAVLRPIHNTWVTDPPLPRSGARARRPNRSIDNDQAPAATASATPELPLATASSSASASAATAPITVTTGF